MFRFNDCLCGTTTTGTGDITCTTIPSGAGGGMDFDTAARAQGLGNNAIALVDLCFCEFTDATYTTEKQKEVGTYALVLGASAGIGNCKIYRTSTPTPTISLSDTGLNTTTPSRSIPGTSISIGTAANVLIFCAPRTESLIAVPPYINTTGSDSNWGASPEGKCYVGGNLAFPTSNRDIYQPFRVSCPMVAKRCSFRVSTYSAPAGSPVIYVRIYDIGTDGRPGKLLYDFTPSAGVAITATGAYSTGASGNGIKLDAGDYYMDFALTGLTGGTVTMTGASPSYQSVNAAAFRLGVVSGNSNDYAFASSATAGAGPDPANLTSWALNGNASGNWPIYFGLNPS